MASDLSASLFSDVREVNFLTTLLRVEKRWARAPALRRKLVDKAFDIEDEENQAVAIAGL